MSLSDKKCPSPPSPHGTRVTARSRVASSVWARHASRTLMQGRQSLPSCVMPPRSHDGIVLPRKEITACNSRRLEARTCLCTSECPIVRRELASLAHFAARAARPTAFLCNEAPETRTHHADNSSVLVSHPRDHNCSAVVIPNMPGQLHSGASIRVPCDPFLHDHGRLLRLLLGIEWTVPRVHVWHDMLEHPNLLPR